MPQATTVTRQQFISGPGFTWPIINIPLTTPGLNTILDLLAPIAANETIWDAIKTLFFIHGASSYETPEDFADTVEEWAASNSYTAWADEVPPGGGGD